MKRLIFLICGILCLAAVQALAADIPDYDKANAETDGRLIAQAVEDANRPAQDLMTFAVMTLKSGSETTDTRKVIIKKKTYGEVDRTLFRFIDSLKRGTTFLTIEHNEADNEQYLFIPSMGRPRQIATADRQNDFEDTDFTNEELGGRKIDDYTYQRKKDAEVQGRRAYVIVAAAKDPGARYPKYMAWIDRETLLPLQVKVYNRDNKLQKAMVAGDIRQVGTINLPFTMVGKDFIRDHTTAISVKEAKTDTGLDGVLFDKEKMGAKWAEEF